MNVLVACEESQRVCAEFRKRGHTAFSCDLADPSGGVFEWHVKGDVLRILNGDCRFETMDGTKHEQAGSWDLIIAFPPCTYLSNAGAARLFKNQREGDFQMVNVERLKKGIQGRDFFMAMLNARCDHIAVENPMPSGIYVMPKPSQIIHPWMFGDPYTKRTYLWLKGLPPLFASELMGERHPWICGNVEIWHRQAEAGQVYGKEKSAKHRSKTFPGIARAMAEQWG